MVDMLGGLPLLVLNGNWVDHRLFVRFVYDDSYHLDLSTVLYKALYVDIRVASLVDRIR